jgi:hypothetical protein
VKYGINQDKKIISSTAKPYERISAITGISQRQARRNNEGFMMQHNEQDNEQHQA